MTAIALTAVILLAALLMLVTLIQMLYMDSVRVRAKEIEFLEFFRESLSDRLDLTVDDGILRFSLIKHTCLTLIGIAVLVIVSGGPITPTSLVEALVISWLAMLVCAYIVPQTLYRRTTGHWFVPMLPLVKLLAAIVKPVAALLGFLHSLVQLGRTDEGVEENGTAEDGIDALIDAGAEEGILQEQDRRLIQSVVAFGDKTVREVMTPRPQIVAIRADVTLEDLRELVINEQFSRIPVFEDTIDQVIGFVHVRDMFEVDHTERTHRLVRELVRPVRFVPETKPVNDLLREMQKDGAHMAMVVDEYGSTAGLVTMEDMVEEIVGEIRDEHEPGHDVERDDTGGIIVSGSFDVDHLDELMEFRASDETESTTVGGLVTEWMGRVPTAGDSVERDGIRIEVLAANELRVDQVRISKVDEKETRNGNNHHE
jgi:CBS domain containing-hemolysin-like protein